MLSKRLTDSIKIDTGTDPFYGWMGSQYSPYYYDPDDPDLIIDPQVYASLEKDDQISAVLQKRVLAVTSKEWELTPNGDDLQALELVKTAINKIPIDSITSDLLDANLKGCAALKVDWKYDESCGLNLPVCEFVGQHRLNFVPSCYMEGYTTHQGYDVRIRTKDDPQLGILVPKKRLLIYSVCHGTKNYNRPNGRGLASRLYRLKMFRDELIKFMLIYGDKYTSPIPIAERDREIAMRSVDDLEDMLERLTQGLYGILPPGVKLNYLESDGQGNDYYERIYDLFGRGISKIVLGETGTTDQQGNGGSRARDQVGDEVRLEIAKADADGVGQVINQLIQWIVDVNQSNYRNAPTFYRVFPKDEDALSKVKKQQNEADKTKAETYKLLFDMGFRPQEEVILEDFPGWEYDDEFQPEPEQPETEAEESKNDNEAEIELDVLPEYASRSFTPPKAVQEAAKRGLELRQQFNRGGTEIGVARARDLSNGKGISPDTIKRMVSYFARHEVDKQGQGWGDRANPSAGYIAWLLWGGDTGRTWANKIAKQISPSYAASEPVKFGNQRPLPWKDVLEIIKVEDKDLADAITEWGSFAPRRFRNLLDTVE